MPFLFFIFSFSFAQQADAEWIKLLHFEKNIFGTYVSRSNSENFFTSPERNPTSELQSFLKAYDIPVVNDDHVVCKFPLRAKYVVKKGYKKAIASHCPKLEKFKQTLAPVGVSLLFSSYFLESPGSIFGHTFLRLRRNLPKVATQEQIELLDHGIGYAANATTSNPLLHALLGFTGGFDGVFSLVPYYYKVREYNDNESRDLWSYDLEMSAKEMDDLVDHLWEVGRSTFPYYYLTENCSYYILEILEIVTKRKLVSRMPPWMIPVDSIKAIMEEPGFVKEISYRPSLKNQFLERAKTLNSDQIKQVQTFKYGSSWSTAQIDTGIEYLELKHPKEVREKNSEPFLLRDQLLRERSKRRDSSSINVPRPASPDLIHPSSRAGLLAGYDKRNKSFLSLQQRFAYYDPLDPPEAKPAFSEVIFMDLSAQYFEDTKKLKLEKSDLIRAKVRTPYTSWFKPMSYSFTLGGERDRLLCESCYTFLTHIDFGVSYELSENLFYLGLYNDFKASSKMSKGYGYYVGPSIEITSYWAQSFRTKLDLSYLDVVDQDLDAFVKVNFEARLDVKKDVFSLSASYMLIDTITETRLGLYYYY
ncbi:MAG: DUF4105 domain-containing protein [Bdellovibrionales bacterium]|nr:DUF4105 domain-containing protein [Bdellovibrionales bacterium]